MLKNLHYSLLLLLLVCACNTNKNEDAANFYHWKQTLDLTNEEKEVLKNTNTDKMYVRFFDVVWSERHDAPIPVSVLEVDSKPKVKSVVPVIFITNENFTEKAYRRYTNGESWTIDLAERVAKRIQKIYSQNFSGKIKEVQIDCDWSDSTRDNYFQFLTDLRSQLPKGITLTTTIRLHQVKYFERTGLPPADKGVLMLYNMGEFSKENPESSIFNQKTTESYLSNFENYPLPLDLALPIFSWTVEFNRFDKIELLNGIKEADLQDKDWLEKQENGLYLANQYGTIKNAEIAAGSYLKPETVTQQDLKWAVKKMKTQINNAESELLFYALDSTYINDFDAAFLNTLTKEYYK